MKFSLLGLLYLFLLRVVRAVWAELAPPAAGAGAPATRRRFRRRSGGVPNAEPPTGAVQAPTGPESPRRKRRAERTRAPHLAVVAPPEAGGANYALDAEELTIGRADGCAVALDDNFVSQVHARLFRRDDRWLVEDLGSTNGTWLNGDRVGGPRPLTTGDRIQVGGIVLELR